MLFRNNLSFSWGRKENKFLKINVVETNKLYTGQITQTTPSIKVDLSIANFDLYWKPKAYHKLFEAMHNYSSKTQEN
jgi:hypothetical protein